MTLRYTGARQPPAGAVDDRGQPLLPYLPDPELVEAVQLAMSLRRPLLLKGEPGSGKTRLAAAVAWELGLPYHAWHVKSTSRARDGLYTYDALGRLRDVQLLATQRASPAEAKRAASAESYVRLGPLGEAFQAEHQAVVLIDEIDKADIDFPNDLLLELDEQRFTVEETSRTVTARAAPFVVITSNDEKDLPDAFLRRCLFHFVEFPGTERLVAIVRAHFQEASPRLVEAAVRRFDALRADMVRDKGEAGKRASTSELIDWFRALAAHPEDEALRLLGGRLPFASVLLKSWDDHRRYLSAPGSRGRP